QQTYMGQPRNNRSSITAQRFSCAARPPAACPSNARVQTVSGASAAPVRTHCQRRSQLRMAVSLLRTRAKSSVMNAPKTRLRKYEPTNPKPPLKLGVQWVDSHPPGSQTPTDINKQPQTQAAR